MSNFAHALPDFDVFFHALWNHDPFPWQQALAKRIVDNGRWPETLGLPTAAGKTAALDIAVYHLAAEAERQAHSRRAPRRIFFVVDRRVIVDEAHERAEEIATKLAGAHTSSQLAAIAERLRYGRRLNADPLVTVVLRGGIYRDSHWVRDPSQPLICVSTVDQIGSRMLFRGYGVSIRARPIHAALTVHDALYLLDEAHLSNPFVQTLETVQRQVVAERALPGATAVALATPFAVCKLTATPGESQECFTETAADREHPVLSRRWGTSKPALLSLVKCQRNTQAMSAEEERAVERANCDRLVEAAAAAALSLNRKDGANIVAVILNEVATARAVFRALKEADEDAFLFTGRSRPFDRLHLLHGPEQLHSRLKAAPAKRTGATPCFIVATQCLEAGADYDFDALVTECASLDALRQRFGRLARSGRDQHGPAVILGRSDHIATGAEHFLYGKSLAKTWEWLNSAAKRQRHPNGEGPVVDFAQTALAPILPVGDALLALLAPKPDAPVLLPAHLEAWSQTNPAPYAEPEVSLFLHGPESRPADVQVVWRADLDPRTPANWHIAVASLPPCSSEALPLPLSALVHWLADRSETSVSDLEGTQDELERDASGPVDRLPCALRWVDSEESEVIFLNDLRRLRPGDTVVLPASAGGCDRFGWAPESVRAVMDVAEPALLEQRGKLWFRIAPAVWEQRGLPKPDALDLLQRREDGELSKDALLSTLGRTLAMYSALAPPEAARLIDTAIAALTRPSLWRLGAAVPAAEEAEPAGLVLVCRKRMVPGARMLRSHTLEFADDVLSSGAERDVTLLEHTEHVVQALRLFAEECGLPVDLRADLTLAAAWHDLGKVDPRFQLKLGRSVGTDGEVIATRDALAKSSAVAQGDDLDPWPVGARHEALSVAFAASQPELRERANDPTLVLHLIASHHGWARPIFLPVIEEKIEQPLSVCHHCRGVHPELTFTAISGRHLYELASGVCHRFHELQRRYGHYHLALIETLLRLADWRASETPDEI
jgi:CRISPR-associated endonuclease/helicase Cas3